MGGTSVGLSPGAWRAVTLLCCLYAVSFLDRMVLALVLDPVSRSLGVDDTQISLLFGMGFVVVYILAGFPAAHLIDTGNRKRILITGVLIWSAATFLSGFATSYAMLVVFRSGIAIGEAVLTPAAMSLIGDLFSKERRAHPTTVYTLTGVMMGSGSFIVGSGALRLAEMLAPAIGLEAWRIMFQIVALPGLILAVLFAWFVVEPPRQREEAKAGTASSGEFLRHFRSRLDLYLPIFLGTGCVFTITMGMKAWAPTLLVREHGAAPASAGLYFGSFAIAGAIVGMIVVAPVVRWLGRRSRAHGVLYAAILVNLTVLPVLALLVGAADTRWALAGIAIGTCGSIATATFTPILMQAVTPSAMLGRMSALYLMFNNLFGMGMGPLIVASLASGAGTTRSIGQSLTLIAWTGIATSLTCYVFALWRLRRTETPSSAASAAPARVS